MPELVGWEQIQVRQKDPKFGCIPAGYEWMIRFAGIKEVNLDTFQDDFNLQLSRVANNNFKTIADAIKKKYPLIDIKHKNFQNGSEKVKCIDELMKKQIPCLISLPLPISPSKISAHIMPVVKIDAEKLTCYNYNKPREYSRVEVIEYHKKYYRLGINDIAWLNYKGNSVV
jgi:hypothetical protein